MYLIKIYWKLFGFQSELYLNITQTLKLQDRFNFPVWVLNYQSWETFGNMNRGIKWPLIEPMKG